jgi:hypothetical protein
VAVHDWLSCHMARFLGWYGWRFELIIRERIIVLQSFLTAFRRRKRRGYIGTIAASWFGTTRWLAATLGTGEDSLKCAVDP